MGIISGIIQAVIDEIVDIKDIIEENIIDPAQKGGK